VTALPGSIDRPRSWQGPRGGRLIAPEILFLFLGGVFIVALLLGVGVGAFSIAPDVSMAILLDRAHLLGPVQSALDAIGIDWAATYTQQESAVLWAIRLPSVIQAAIVGGGLAIA